MKSSYSQLSSEERNMIQRGLIERLSIREISRMLNRAPSTISREIARCTRPATSVALTRPAQRVMQYDAVNAARMSRLRRQRGPRKLAEGSALREIVIAQLRQRWSPEQIACRLRRMNPDQPETHVSHETIYAAIYATPKGELRKSLISMLRRAHAKRLPRTRGEDRRGCLPDMLSIHKRPDEVIDRLVPGHWEGDFIKGAGNRSGVGTLVERHSRYVLLAKMDGVDAKAALDGFTRAFQAVPGHIRKTLTYDQGKEMARHVELSQRLELRVFFADPHSPWQRPTNENTYGLIRQYLPKGTDLSVYSQAQLDEIAWQINNRPRKVLDFETPTEVYDRLINNLDGSVALQT